MEEARSSANNDELTQHRAVYDPNGGPILRPRSPDPGPVLRTSVTRRCSRSARSWRLEALGDDSETANWSELENLKFVETIGRPGFDAVMLPIGGKNLP